jgi:hypothetical protein
MPDEPTPPSEPTPSPAQAAARRSCNWHRVRVYLLSILLIVSMWMGAVIVTIRLHPKRIVNKALAQLSFESSTGKVYWVNRRTLKIEDLKLGGFFYANAITLTASPWGLWRHHIAKIQIDGGQLYTKPLYEQMDKMGPGNGKGLDWVIGRLEITRGTVLLQNLVEDTSIPVRLGVRHPIVLSGLRLGEPDSSPEMKIERSVEIVNVNITSTVDPTVNVFTFPLTRVRFTYSEFWHHHIREIDLIRPTMYLGEDLFWLTKQFKNQTKTAASNGPTSPWNIGHFEISYGRMAVNAFGQPIVHFPFFFDTKVDNIRLDQLDQISAKATIPIQNFTQDYPDYKVQIVNLTGKLYFSWPPSDAAANNVVNTIHINEVAWNDIPVTNVNTDVTFDPKGVYGKLSGTCEGGSLAGNFEFYYTKGFTWNADFFASKINCGPIAEKMVGKYCNMTGELDGKISVQGKATDILKCTGLLELPHPGILEFKSMDELIDRIPADMITLKRDAIKIAVNAFQKYPYDTGELKLNYDPTGGLSSLKLTGPYGKRSFEVALHPYSNGSLTEELK